MVRQYGRKKSVGNRSLTRLDKRSLEHIREERQDGIQRLEIRGLAILALAVLDASEELSEHGQVKDKRSGQKGVLNANERVYSKVKAEIANLALVEDINRRPPTAEYLRIILINRPLRIAHRRHILDDHDMVRVLTLPLRPRLRSLVQESIGIHHIIHDAALADLLAPELSLSRQVMPIIVAKVVVRSDGERLDAGIDEKLGEDGLELGLARLEVVATDKGLVTLGEVDDTSNERVLGCTVDKRLTLKDGSNGKERGWGDLRVGRLDSLQDVVCGVVDTGNNVAVPLGVRGPEDKDTIQIVVRLELADVCADLIEVDLLVFAGDHVVSSGFLVGCDEVGVVDGWERLAELGHVWRNLTLEVVVQDLSTAHGLVHGNTRDVPSTEDEVIGVDHGEDIRDGEVNVVTSGRVDTNAHSGGTKDRPNVVGLLKAGLGVPGDVVLVGEDGGAEGAAIVTSNPDHHETAGHFSLGNQT